MIGNSSFSVFIDKVFAILANVLTWILENVVTVIFSNHIITVCIYFILINFVAIVLMKKDKEFAQTGAKRVRESTLLMVALVGGGLGEYYAMYKYKHKTLHNKFLYGVPIAIMLNAAMITYSISLIIFA